MIILQIRRIRGYLCEIIQLVLMKYFGEGINSKAVSVCGASRSKSFGLKVLAEQGPVHCGLDIVQIN